MRPIQRSHLSLRADRHPAWILIAAGILAMPSCAAVGSEPGPEVLIRIDDIGMNHTVNTAMRKLIETGVPFSASVMVPCPWFLEAADILRDTPQASVGIHLTLNSEWKHYKWGPVLGAAGVPSLVDANGHFFATRADLLENGMDPAEAEAELRAQIERARTAGLEIDYLDYHMLTALSTPELRSIVEKLAAEYGLGLSRYFGEPSLSLWDAEPDKKLVTLLDGIGRATTGKPTLIVIHLGMETAEMNALVDLNNPVDPYRVALHRRSELDAVTSHAFRQAAAERGIRFVTYRDLVERYGLDSMAAPGSAGYSMNEQGESQ